ncbi:hypothetical protein BS47DRAFT_1367017 [Hydnum rufescens UP504]|uniref:Uncharacterized protein n=1 Tax=Hydnum rufescens UP504 TaxID=1448309 RepID=A0A9P6DLG5_9AGAM|nr:hypothetical protein BS47DRAFT_1367017 [Hydnum rufescens UP504]
MTRAKPVATPGRLTRTRPRARIRTRAQPQTHATTDEIWYHTPAVAGILPAPNLPYETADEAPDENANMRTHPRPHPRAPPPNFNLEPRTNPQHQTRDLKPREPKPREPKPMTRSPRPQTTEQNQTL